MQWMTDAGSAFFSAGFYCRLTYGMVVSEGTKVSVGVKVGVGVGGIGVSVGVGVRVHSGGYVGKATGSVVGVGVDPRFRIIGPMTLMYSNTTRMIAISAADPIKRIRLPFPEKIEPPDGVPVISAGVRVLEGAGGGAERIRNTAGLAAGAGRGAGDKASTGSGSTDGPGSGSMEGSGSGSGS